MDDVSAFPCEGLLGEVDHPGVEEQIPQVVLVGREVVAHVLEVVAARHSEHLLNRVGAGGVLFLGRHWVVQERNGPALLLGEHGVEAA